MFYGLQTLLEFSVQGVYDRESRCVHLFTRGDRRKKLKATIVSIEQAADLKEAIGENFYNKLLEDIEVLDSLVSPPDMERIQVRLLITLKP